MRHSDSGLWQSRPYDVVTSRPVAPYLPIAITIGVLAVFVQLRIWEWFDALLVQIQQALHVGAWA